MMVKSKLIKMLEAEIRMCKSKFRILCVWVFLYRK